MTHIQKLCSQYIELRILCAGQYRIFYQNHYVGDLYNIRLPGRESRYVHKTQLPQTRWEFVPVNSDAGIFKVFPSFKAAKAGLLECLRDRRITKENRHEC